MFLRRRRHEPQPFQRGDRVGAVEYRDRYGAPTSGIRAIATENWSTKGPARVEFYTQPADRAALEVVVAFHPIGWSYWLDDEWHLSIDEPVHYERRHRVYRMEPNPFQGVD